MSWSISKQGTHDEVRQAVADDAHVPAEVSEAIDSVLGAFAPDTTVNLQTNGHIDTDAKTGDVAIAIKTV